MIAPIVSILFRRLGDLMLGWNPLPTAQCKSYNVYSCPTAAGVYTFLVNVQNRKDTAYGYKTRVVSFIKDTDIPIVNPTLVRYYFKVTFIDINNVESDINLSIPVELYPAQIEHVWENEDKTRNAHNMGWIEERQRWEKIKLDANGNLLTNAVVDIGTIQLGNVKVAQKPDNATLDYILIDDNRKLVVRLDQDSIVRIADYEETPNIAKNVETTILTYTNAIPYYIEKIVCTGSSDAKFKMKINGNTIRTLRNAWNDRNATFDFSTIARKIPATSTVTITATHFEKVNQSFEASLDGFTFTI